MPQYDPSDLISFTEAAREKDCGRNTLYRAADRGELTTVEVGGRTMIVRDADFRAYKPNWVGERARQYHDDAGNG